MMTTTATTKQGIEIFRDLMGNEKGDAFAGVVEAGGMIGDLARLAADFAFAAVWARPGLKRSQRSLVTLGVLIAQGHVAEIRNHLRIALTNGLTPEELEEVVIQAVPYAGFPAVANVATALIEVLRETSGEAAGTTPEEKGLL